MEIWELYFVLSVWNLMCCEQLEVCVVMTVRLFKKLFLKLLPRDERVKKNKIATAYNVFYKGSLTPLFWVKLKYTYEVNITKITVPQKFVLFQNMQTANKSLSRVLLLMDKKRKGSNSKMKREKKTELYQAKCTSVSAPQGNTP